MNLMGEKRAWNDGDVPFFSSLQKKRREKSFPDYHANLKIGSSMVAAAFVTLQMLNWFFSLDGIGAFDHISRAEFVEQLDTQPEVRSLLPLVMALYSSESRFVWRDSEG